MSLLATGSVSLADLNDAIISGTAPSSPAIGTLWIDTSVNPSVLKSWNGSAWVPQTLDISNLDPVTVSNIITTLGNMADDNILDINERTTLKDQLTEIIGFVISNASATLPTVSALDTSAKGDFYSVRHAAQLAGISTGDATYTATGTQWTNLSAYLNGMTPVKPWDVSSANSSQTITVVRDTFRTNWLNYYQSIQNLAQKTADILKQAAQNAQSTADSKAKNWVTQPVPPYSVGDKWIQGTSEWVCITARSTGSFTASDWRLSSDITGQNTANDTNNVNGRSSVDITQTIDGNSQAILDMNGEINAKVDQETYQTEITGLNESMGVDQWHYQKYPLPSGYTASTIPSYTSIQGANPIADSLVNDGTNIVQNSETNYVGHVQTAVYVATAKTVTVTFSHDDSCQVYVNGQSKYTKNAVTTGASLSLPLVQGWNTIEFFWTQISGTAGVYAFSPTIRSLVDKMSCYYASITGRVVANSEAQLLIQAGQISQKVSTTDYNGNTIGTLINQGTTTVKIQAARLELLTSSAFDTSTYSQINNANVQVGGTNLVTKGFPTVVSGTTVNSSDGYDYNLSATTTNLGLRLVADSILGLNKTYTLSYKVKYISGSMVNFGGNNRQQQVGSVLVDNVAVSGNYHNGIAIPTDGNFHTVAVTIFINTSSGTDAFYLGIEPNRYNSGLTVTFEVKDIKLELGNKATDWSPAPADQQNYADSVASTAQSGAVSQANTYTDSQVTGVNTSITNLQQQTQNAGGVNLVQNSLGIATVVDDTDPNYGKLLNWKDYSGNLSASGIINGDIQALNFEGGIYLQAGSPNYASVYQAVYCPSTQISIGFYVSSATVDGGTGNTEIGVAVYPVNQDGSFGTEIGRVTLKSNGSVNNLPFKYLSGTLSVSTSQVYIFPFAATNTKGIITGLMVNDGAIPLRWSNYPSENYTTQMRLDQTGIKVIGETTDNYTEMTPDHFAGYAPDAETGIKTKIFELNGDVTHVHKLQADRYVKLGSVQAVMFDNGANTGWAFFPTNNQD